LITKADAVLYNKRFGFSDYEHQELFTNDTAFKIGLTSQLVTANIITEMAKRNQFQLTDTISKFIPAINSDATINDLLHHKTSFPSIKIIQAQHPELQYTTIAFSNEAVRSPKVYGHSDLNYNILGLLIETIGRKSYQEQIEDYSQKLGLENTYFQKANATAAVGYLYNNAQGNGLELEKATASNLDITFSSNGLKSSARDLAKIIRFNSEKKLNIEGYLENDGFSYALLTLPQKETAVIVLSNRRHPVAKEISYSIEAIMKDQPYHLPLARKAVTIDAALLKDYAGTYALNSEMNLRVVNENDSLFIMMGPNKIHLIPQSSNQFYMEQMDAGMRFIRDSSNTVNDVLLMDGFLDGTQIKRVQK